jgi:hypothetical protein
MPRTPLPFHADDISALARSLKAQLAAAEHPPGHAQLLNMLARSAGARNFQHFRVERISRLSHAAAPPAADPAKLARLVRYFNTEGQLLHWPSRAGDAELCLWVLWSRLPARQPMSERAIGERLDLLHRFSDRALLRRALADYRLVQRTRDGSEYRRVETEPPALALALIRRVGGQPRETVALSGQMRQQPGPSATST